MAADLFSLIDELFGRSDWDVSLLPTEGRPRLLMQFGSRYSPLTYVLTEASRERLRELKAGSPRIEAQGPQSMAFDLMPLDHQALGWKLHRDRRRLAIMDRDRVEIAVYFNPRPVIDAGEGAPLEETKKPHSRRGNTGFDDTEVVAAARDFLAKMQKPAKDGAAEAVINQLIKEREAAGLQGPELYDGNSREAWINRVRQKL